MKNIQGIPSHCGIPGNEKVDGLSKKGCLIIQAPYNLVSYKSASSTTNQTLKTTHMSLLKNRTKEKQWRNAIFNLPDCSRSISVAAFRLMTGNDCLYAHLCRIRIVDSPAWPLCCSSTVMNADHLPVCSVFTKNCIYSGY
ncbi:hypothetical protein NPIL_403671 [Nephila pilipes]|uniref:RNase H type-1 domain-containing protein n=1 Tax=Nephila pilipes TaxID=299642 RepID=A0A8X6R066_NEPPI|nr:hypothetical protein NPIL_403671 [Nephila pilipes]